MDFRVPAAGARLAFAYVLPFTAIRALVEAVVLGHERASASRLNPILDVYLEEQFGDRGEVLAIEEWYFADDHPRLCFAHYRRRHQSRLGRRRGTILRWLRSH